MKSIFFILDLDEEKFYSKHGENEERDYSLLKEGELTKLPACESCFNLLRHRNRWAAKHPDIKLENNLGQTSLILLLSLEILVAFQKDFLNLMR